MFPEFVPRIPGVDPEQLENYQETLVTSENDLRDLIAESYKRAGLTIENDLAVIENIVEHESQHNAAAQMLGAVGFYYILRTWEKPFRWQTLYNVTLVGATILDLAAIIAHPKELSKIDKRDLTQLGYIDVEKVGFEIIKHNETNEKQIPLPMSYLPPRGRVTDLSQFTIRRATS